MDSANKIAKDLADKHVAKDAGPAAHNQIKEIAGDAEAGQKDGVATDGAPAPAARAERRGRYTRDYLDKAALTLKELPPKEKAPSDDFTRYQVVEYLSAEIQSLRERGYSVQDIAAQMTALSIHISAATLQNYHQAVRKEKDTGKRAVRVRNRGAGGSSKRKS